MNTIETNHKSDDEIFYAKIKEETSGNIKELVELKDIEKTTKDSIELSNKVEDEVNENLTLLLEKLEVYLNDEEDETRLKGFLNVIKNLFQLFLSNDEYHEVEELLMSHENKRKNILAEMVRFFKLLFNKIFQPKLQLSFNEQLLKEIDKLLEKLKGVGLSKEEIAKIGEKLKTLSLFLMVTSIIGLIATSLSSFNTKIVDSLKLDVVKNENSVNMRDEKLEEVKVRDQLYADRGNDMSNIAHNTNLIFSITPTVASVAVIAAMAFISNVSKELQVNKRFSLQEKNINLGPLHRKNYDNSQRAREERQEEAHVSSKPTDQKDYSTMENPKSESGGNIVRDGYVNSTREYGCREYGNSSSKKDPQGCSNNTGEKGSFSSLNDLIGDCIRDTANSNNVGVPTSLDNGSINGFKSQSTIRYNI